MIQDAGWVGGQHPMTRPLSNDLRERVVAAMVSGESCRSVAARFGVAVSSVVKWSQRYRATGSVAPGKMRWTPQAGAGSASRIHRGADQADATSDAARAERRTRGARRHRLTQCGVDVPAARGAAVQKKHCSPLSRPAPTSRAGVSDGVHGRPASIRDDWCSSTKPGSRPTWPCCADGGRRQSACVALPCMATGGSPTFLGALRCDQLGPMRLL